MRKGLRFASVILALVAAIGAVGCKGKDVHVHKYTEVAAAEATCEKGGNIPYYKCDCGKAFMKEGSGYTEVATDEVLIPSLGHTFAKDVKEIESTCAENGVKAHAYCATCKKLFLKNGENYVQATEEELLIAKKAHVYDREKVTDEYRLSEATENAPQKFAKSCVCGAFDETGALTFEFGKTLGEYKNDDASLYAPHALSLSIYDAKSNTYGFTWNADKVSSRPVVEIKETGKNDSLLTIGATADEMQSYKKTSGADEAVSVYYVRAAISLKANAEYEYRVGDKYVGAYTDYVTFKTVNPTETETWSFAHVSDSQTLGEEANGGKNSSSYYAATLKGIAANPLNKFILHTGDVVEWSKYESYWRYMFDDNFDYFSKIPTMALAGNHDTTYKSGEGSSETFKHFNYAMPAQSTAYGFYYAYSYGDVKFIMINTNDLTAASNLKAEQMKWLENELKKTTEKWTIVSLHNPLYSPGKWGSGPNNSIARQLTAQLSDLFAEYEVDLVLQGHDHMISRTKPLGIGGIPARETKETIDGVEYSVNPEGTIYVMNGPAGDQSRTEVYPHDDALYDYAEGSETCSWAEFTVSGNMITVYVKTASSGSVVTKKTWGIKKG